MDPQHLEDLKMKFNNYFETPFNNLKILLTKISDDLCNLTTIKPSDFKRATDALAYLIAIDDGNRPQVYEGATRLDWTTYKQFRDIEGQGSFTVRSIEDVQLKRVG